MTTRKQRVSRKQEGRITKSLQQIMKDTKQAMASGSLWFQKSDVINELFRVECKTKEKASSQITIKKEWLEKIKYEAFETNKIGMLAFSFGDNTDYFALESDEFITLIEELLELRKKFEEESTNEDT